jgi:hypothetical protein
MIRPAASRAFATYGLFCCLLLSGCGSPAENDGMVPVNLSLVVDSNQAQVPSHASRVIAFLEQWLIGGTDAWAQLTSDIRSLEVLITGPGISEPPSTTVALTNATPGQLIPVSIQAPTGSNRTITVTAFNGSGTKIFAGHQSGVSLTPGPPISLTITLVRVFTVTVNKQGNGTGTLTSSPVDIDCEPGCTTQSAQFEVGTAVSLTASAAAGSAFTAWGGACSGNGACTVTNNATVTATFILVGATHHLNVNIVGTGSAIVTSNPSGINCGPICGADFPSGSTVVLTATGILGTTFTGWNGAGCSGTGSCVVVMTADQTVSATFSGTVSTSTLVVSKAGAGSGTVTSNPAGINCGQACTADFPSSNSVTLTAVPLPGSTFAGWSGSNCGGTGTCVVSMNGNKTVTATFNLAVTTSTLTVTKAGAGSGTVASSPAGINCGATCNAPFPTASSVTLTANAAAGSVFAGWSGGGCSGTGPCTTVMATSQTIVATFNAVPMSTLTVTKSGNGNGTVMSSPAGINCGNDCNQSFAQGTTVTLTANPAGNMTFGGWSAPCAGTGTCTITLNANTTVNATFTRVGG